MRWEKEMRKKYRGDIGDKEMLNILMKAYNVTLEDIVRFSGIEEKKVKMGIYNGRKWVIDVIGDIVGEDIEWAKGGKEKIEVIKRNGELL